MSINVIHVHGRAKIAYLDGERIEREDKIFVRSENSWFPTVDSDNHFVYRQTKRLGSSLMCTCGSSAGIYLYDAYMRFTSINKGRMICCNSFIQNNGKHGDGSS
jgi:hypothetical protein